MFRYLMLCVSLVLALPSYAASSSFFGGETKVSCPTNGDGRSTIPFLAPLNGSVVEGGQMKFGITGIQFSASVDNPVLTGLTAVGPGFECPAFIGFRRVGESGLAGGLIQVGTLQITSPWFDNEYFDIGNGLAMRLIAGDRPTSQQLVTQGQSTITTYNEVNKPGTTKLGLYTKATLKVIDKNVALGQRNIVIGTFRYKLTDASGRTQVVYAPISFDIQVTQANLRSCELTTKDREFNLTAVKRQDVFVRGTEVPGGNITIGPVRCQEGVDVKVNFYDHHNTQGLTDHLRTVYSDTLQPSQYALKIYPTTGGQPLKFLPLAAFKGGTNPVINETTVNFATNTVAGSSIQKNYRVNYVRLGTVGNDRPGKIKGIMTVEFLYY